jgi:hypothetical protein
MPRKYIRKTGEAARALSLNDRRRLREFRARHAARLGFSSLSIPALKTSIGAPFTWETLKRALEGKKIRADNYEFIKEFLDRVQHKPPVAVGLDRKSVSAGEREYEEVPPKLCLDRDLVASRGGYRSSQEALSPKHSPTEEETQDVLRELDRDAVAEITHRGSR